MAKVLLVDTNFSSTPIYNYLVDQGYDTHVVGGRPADCLAKITPNYTNLDYSDTESLKLFVREEAFDYIVPGCTDRSYASCVAVNDGRFPGIESRSNDQSLNDKEQFRALLAKLDLPTPGILSPELEPISWPLVVKPVDGFSGKGISILQADDAAELDEAITKAKSVSAKGRFVVEEFVEGQLHSHSAFIVNGKVHKDFVVEEHSSVNPFVVDTSYVLSQPEPELLYQLRQAVEAIANELDLNDGLLHTQFIKNESSIWLIEITRRCPGDLYSQLIELSTGFNYVESYVRPFLGKQIESRSELSQQQPVMRHTITVQERQNLSCVSFSDAVRIVKWVPLSLTGDLLEPSPGGRVAIVFVSTEKIDSLKQLVSQTIQKKLYMVCG